jgi:hypothetical protein
VNYKMVLSNSIRKCSVLYSCIVHFEAFPFWDTAGLWISACYCPITIAAEVDSRLTQGMDSYISVVRKPVAYGFSRLSHPDFMVD